MDLEERGSEKQDFMSEEIDNQTVKDTTETKLKAIELTPTKSEFGLKGIWIALIVIALAVIGLYIAHFTSNSNNGGNKTTFVGSDTVSMLVLTIDNDSITDTTKYELARILLSELTQEMDKYQRELASKSSSLQERYQNYMINKQSGVLTQSQMDRTEKQLTSEQAALEALNAKYSTIMEQKQINVQNEIRDSIINATNRVNERYHADYIFAKGMASVIVHSNPIYDITNEVLEEMNRAYKASETSNKK
ncbi:MAG: OmpH family outer membrane protein [Bacteroidales bacterium]|jgi:Skp family chaperone for outer membrane proteins|nr:OmpH family outer membrane protein [Bacteroidales bacterium]